MRKALLIILLIFLFVLVGFLFSKKEKLKVKKEEQEMKAEISQLSLITVYDNYRVNPELKTGWGFSCLVRINDKHILFDTGADSETLFNNMEKMRIEPRQFDAVFLSHIHGDHTGGLERILKENPQITVYLPKSFPESFKENVKGYGAKVVEIDNSLEILEEIYSTGELGARAKEQSLIINTDKGLVIITGCSHPGIVNIVEKAKEITEKEVYLVLGGFHLAGASDAELKSIIADFRKLGVEIAAPCHCSGDRCRELFKKEYKEDFIANGVGKIIEIE